MENAAVSHPDKKPSLLRKLGRFLMVLILLPLLTGVGLSLFVYFYQDEIKAAILKEINRHLKAEVKIAPSDIDLTIFSSFPECALRFKNGLMLEPGSGKKRDTLMFAGGLSLQFNLSDIWNKKYIVKSLKLRDARIRLRVDKNGKANYIFWEDQGKGEQAAFELEDIEISNSELRYTHHSAATTVSAKINALAFSGKFNADAYTLKTKGDLLLSELLYGNQFSLKDKNVGLNMQLDVKGNRYVLSRADLSLNKLAAKLSGNFELGERLRSLALSYASNELSIGELISLLPSTYHERIKDYSSEGRLYASGDLHYDQKSGFSGQSEFGIENGTIKYKATGTAAENVNLKGRLDFGKGTSSLSMKNIRLSLLGDEISGSFYLSNFAAPEIDVKTEASVRLEHIQSFWPIDTFDLLKGHLQLNAAVRGRVSDLSRQFFSPDVSISLAATVSNIEVKFRHDEKVNNILSGKVLAAERNIAVEDLEMRRGTSQVKINGSLPGFFNYLTNPGSPLMIKGTVSSSNLAMEDFIPKTNSQKSNGNRALIPDQVSFFLAAEIDVFTFGKFTAKNIRGDLEIKNQKAMLNEVSLETMGGTADLNGFADNSKGRLDIILQSHLKNIAITEMFRDLNNFAQNTITDKNLAGILTATLDFAGSWSNALVGDEKSITSSVQLQIDRGELRDFKPLLSLSKFVDIEDLKRVRFSTLSSNIQIRDRVITIPKTSMRNSALNIEAWGTHTFDNVIDYHIQLLVSELLAAKRKKADSEFGEVANDPENRRMAHIRMTGPVENPTIKYDRQSLKTKIREDIRSEKETLRQMFKQELGLFKKDTVRKQDKEATQFQLEEENKPEKRKPLELKPREEEDF